MISFYQKIIRLSLAPTLTVILMAFIFYANCMYPFGNGTMTLSDTIYQTVPFLNDFKDILDGKSSIFLNFQNAGGMNFYGVFFFFLSSPFSLLVKFVDKINMVKFLNVLVTLKMAVGALSCAYCLDCCRKRLDTPFIVMFSLMYAFCGYSMMYYDVNISWLDMAYLFPLLIVGLVRIINNEGAIFYVIVLSVSCVVNYYISYMLAIFILLFGLVYWIINRKDNDTQRVCKEIFLGSLLSVLLSAVVWLPCLIQYSESARSQASIFAVIAKRNLFFHDYQTILPMLMATAAPFVFILMGRRKDGTLYTVISLLMLLPFILEPINLFWHGGNYIGLPCRFGYMSIFMLIFVAAYSLEGIKINKRIKGLWLKIPMLLICGGGVIFTCLYTQNLLKDGLFELSSFVRSTSGDTASFFYITEIFLLISIIYGVLLWSYKRDICSKDFFVSLCGCIFLVEIFFNTSVYMVSSSQFFSEPNSIEANLYNLSGEIRDDDFFRVTARDIFNKDNFNIVGALGYNSVAHYSSLINRNYLETMERLGYSGTLVAILHTGGTRLTEALLSVRYTLDGRKMEVCKNDQYLPVGLLLSKGSLKEAEVIPSNLDRSDVQNYLSKCLIGEDIIKKYSPQESVDKFEDAYFIDDKTVFNYVLDVKGEESLYLDLFNGVITELKEPIWEAMEVWVNGNKRCDSYPAYDENGLLYLGDFHNEKAKITLRFKKYVKCTSFGVFGLDKSKLNDFCAKAEGANLHVKGSGLYGTCRAREDSTLFVSLPYSDNFTVKVNGVKIPYQRALNGFIAFDLPKGENEVSITFMPKGFVVGVSISIIGLVLLGSYVKFGHEVNEYKSLDKLLEIIVVMISACVFVSVYVVPAVIKIIFV